MNGRDLFQLIEQGGVVMYPLLACSIVSLGVIIERLWWLGRAARATRALVQPVLGAIEDGDLQAAAAACRGSTSVLAEPLRRAIASHGKPSDGVERAAQRQLAEAARTLRRNVWLIGTIGSLAPFIGLFGTVLGIVRSFESMAATGSGGFAVVAAGISEALIATAGGLLVGVLSIFAYNAFNVRIAGLNARMREAADEILQRLEELPGREGAIARVAQSR